MAGQVKTYGRNACRALFEARPADLRRVWLTEDAMGPFGDVLRELAHQRKPYKLVPPGELERVAGAKHHEGICILARERTQPSFEELRGSVVGASPARLLYCDGIGNPHNLGAILRVGAHFGAAGVLGRQGEMPSLSAAARRVAEGAAERVPVVPLDAPDRALEALRADGFAILATAAGGERDLFTETIPARVVFLLGAERTGLSDATRRTADRTVRIGGTGAVESLNVATACAVLLAEHWRAHGTAPPGDPGTPR